MFQNKVPHGVRAGPFLFTQGAWGATADGKMVEGTAADRARQIIINLEAILREEDYLLTDVVKCTLYLKHFDKDFASVNKVYEEMPMPRPTRMAMGVTQLSAGGTDVGIEFVACKERP